MTTLPLPVLHSTAPAPAPREAGSDRTIAALCAVTGVALFAVMGVLGVVMRLTQADVLGVSPAWFYRILTLHGAGMLSGALLAMMGALWFVLRADVALSAGRLLAAYAGIVAGAVAVLVATMVGGFAAAWTFLSPLPFYPAGQWRTWSTVVFLIGVFLVGTGFLIFCIDLLEQCTTRYGGLVRSLGIAFLAGRDDDPPPPQVLGAVVVSICGIAASAVGTTIGIALLVKTFDTGAEIDALWAKNLTFFFGHTVANLIIYLAAGVVYTLLPRYAGRPWKTTTPLAVAWLFTLALVLTAYSHHLYMDMVQPRAMVYISSLSSFTAALPVAVVTIFTGLMLVWGSEYRWTLTSRLLYLGFAGWAIGGVGAVIDSIVPVNSRMHNTLWVPGHFHTYLLLGAMFWVFAFIAHILEVAADEPAAAFSSWVAPGLMVIGGYGLTAMWFVSGALGVPRRYAVQPLGTDGYSLAASVFVLIFAAGFIVLLAEFGALWAVARGRREADAAAASVAPVAAAPSRELWRAFREGTTPAVPEPALAALGGGGGVSTAVTGVTAARPPLPALATAGARWTAIGLAVILAALVYTPLFMRFDDDTAIHHLLHAGQFLVGALLGMAVAEMPSIRARFDVRGADWIALALVVVAPAVMLLIMAPTIYGSVEEPAVAHAAFHVGVGALGVLTGVGCARLGRACGWTVLVASVGMALLWAPGVLGG